jgi:hypothetical protein
VAEGGEVILSKDITLTQTLVSPKEVSIDLNGHALTIENPSSTYAISNIGTLTLKDSSNGKGSVTARGIYNGYNNGTTVQTAKLTVESGTYNAVGNGGGAAVYNYGELEVKGGKFTAVGSYALNTQAGGKMTIYEGVTLENSGIYLSDAELIINGGNLNNVRSGCHTIYSWNSNVTINGGTLDNENSGNATLMLAGTSVGTINGGTFSIKDGRVAGNGNTWTSCLLDTANSASLTINDGLYNGGFRVQAGTTCTINGGSFNDVGGSAYNIYGTVAVKGGTYTDATAKKFAQKYVAEGYTGVEENGAWVVIKAQQNNEIWYTSDMELVPTNADALDATIVSNVWDSKTGKGVITFNAPLTIVGDCAFQRETNSTPSNWATSISLPKSVTSIGNYAFAQCYSLTEIVIPDSVVSIGEYAFQSCDAVTKATIGSGVATIASGAFYNCYSLVELVCKPTTPPTVADKWAFSDAPISKVVVPSSAVADYKAANVWSNFNIVTE